MLRSLTLLNDLLQSTLGSSVIHQTEVKPRLRVRKRPRVVRSMEPEQFFFKNYEVQIYRRPFKRTIGVTLQVSGYIRITAPKSASTQAIHAFLSHQEHWIDAHLQKYALLRERYPKKQLREGEVFSFLGKNCRLHFVQGTSHKFNFGVCDQSIVCQVPPRLWNEFNIHSAHPELTKYLLKFYEKSARELLSQRVEFFSAQMNLFPRGLGFRAQRTRWGSCSSQGRISLNWRLVALPIEAIDYVVVHELAHLRHYNHSRSFWTLVEEQLPSFHETRDWLRSHQYEADFLSPQSELHR